MKNLISKFAAVTALTVVTSLSHAALIGSISHDYGDQYTPTSLNSSNSCDTLGADSVNITDTSNGCGRFYDYFDFSSIAFDDIEKFELSLTFSNAFDLESNSVEINLGFFSFTMDVPDSEFWSVRPGASASTGNGYDEDHDQFLVSHIFTGIFTFDDNNTANSIFQNMLNNKNFSLMFAENSANSDNFTLYDAKLDIYGTATVPEPAPLTLLALGLIALGWIRQRKI
ncbi:PEP-CTERM sorting domain-containing protein [Neptunicella sp.]|uniref:PEP-CTERM sorting domain-containing protein n=1 Tax=Neptunicella sp. TaxID=2125986 RepID=UPI003F68C1B4